MVPFPIAEARAAASMSVTDTLLEQLNNEGAGQLEAAVRLGDIVDDPRVVPALAELLGRTGSVQVVEHVVESLGKLGDPRAVPALADAASRGYDPFLA